MDNKLSELSKPVAWTWHAYGMQHATTEEDEHEELIADGVDTSSLYSQEYISALLAELEAKDRRIAELEAKLASLKNEFGELWKGNVDLPARLATPVRLKKVDSSNVPFAGDGFNAAVDYCAEAVRAAGFTVEGDE